MRYTMCFLSAERSNLSERENQQRTAELHDLLSQSNLGFKEVLGSWKGTNESTFSIVIPTDYSGGLRDEALGIVKSLMNDFDQDDVLMVELDNSAWSLRTGEYWGVFTSVDRTQAMSSPGYTYDYDNETYWIVK